MDAGSPSIAAVKTMQTKNYTWEDPTSSKFQLETHIRTFPESFRRWGAKKKKVNSIWQTQISLRSYPLIQSLSSSWLGVLRNLKRVGTFANALMVNLLNS